MAERINFGGEVNELPGAGIPYADTLVGVPRGTDGANLEVPFGFSTEHSTAFVDDGMQLVEGELKSGTKTREDTTSTENPTFIGIQ